MNTEQTARPNMAVNVGGIRMKNPVMVASGTFGYGSEYADLIDVNALGGIAVKGISPWPCPGNPPPRLVETPSGLMNAIGLQNPGVDGFIKQHMPFLRTVDAAVIVNIWGRTLDDYVEVAERLNDIEGVDGLELNISCPNIKEGGIEFGTNAEMTAKLITAVRKRSTLPLIPKLSPHVPDIARFARISEECGADAISLINSVPAMAIDVETRRPMLANVVGGLTGPAVRPIAIKLVWQAAKAVKIPIIGMGGIMSGRDALEFLIAGATAVAVGTANFMDPTTAIRAIDEIEAYLRKHDLSDVADLVGSVEI